MLYDALAIVDNAVGAADNKVFDRSASGELAEESRVVIGAYVDVVELVAAAVKSTRKVLWGPRSHFHVYIGAEYGGIGGIGRVACIVPGKELCLSVDDITPCCRRAYVAYRLAAVAREGLGAGGSAGAGESVGADERYGEASGWRTAGQDGGIIVPGSECSGGRLELNGAGGLERLGERTVGVHSGRAGQIGSADYG